MEIEDNRKIAKSAVAADDLTREPTERPALEAQGSVVQPTVIVLRNGTLKDPITHRFLPGKAPTTAIKTSEQGRAMNRRRLELAEQKARAGLVAAYEHHTGKAGGRPSDAYGELAAEFARSALANAMDKPRDATAAAKLALSLARMSPADQQQQQPAADGLAVTGAGIDFLRDLLQRAAPQVIHVVEGEAHELED